MTNKKLFLVLCAVVWTMFLINLILAVETKNVEYGMNITFTPYCRDISCTTVNVTTYDNSTNMTIVNGTNTTCSANCYGKVKLEGIDNNKLFVEIDIGVSPWNNGNTEIRYGYKTADLGNLSDISGIRQELQNLTSLAYLFNSCSENLTKCAEQKATAETNNINSQSTINSKDEDIKEIKNQRWFYGIGGVVIGVLIIKTLIPFLQGTRIPRDPFSKEFPANVPHDYGR
jgi:hypothetical protein